MSTEPAATSDHPLISAGLTVCPYRMTTYHEYDIASVDSSFGVQVHHYRLLECVGALESACLLGRPPAEWLQVKDHRDALCAGLQLQRDTGLISSNLMVLHQYAIALHRMLTEVLHSVFGREFFPLGAVDDAVPVPRVLRALTQMAVMGIWRPPVGPGGPRPDTVHQDEDCPGCPRCHPRPSG